ncbi:hypothetical protein ERO13_D05G314600v2 [Gossypium hirsutum]|uniref:Neprosin PEP catalytic domain-containing protein n=4 Tax=Gossypium TaxID=3633 RepID=A0A1U8JB93_GOSHI|nr:uncharacterized protein LOC107903847 [Gossypium hirsutum]KAB2031888.1 hypothetical protein ES319_D05G335000v1 [Gossypium barbadense]KAG4148942.1 hypothetical protein ERO13_D05G314600v2 [Gossypium hirsutum]TYG70941.1 hypothetical protein ES288_D05G354900v1 [Gossypium darwinii]TYH73813.1 hypothetical protein ES332_D05G354700v1 [Gossypium tomentosum]
MLILCRIRCPHFDHRIRRLNPCSSMASCSRKTSPIIHAFVIFLLVCSSSISPVYSSEPHNLHARNRTFRPDKELQKLKFIRQRLNKINKPAVKTIQSPDGDTIDCVLSHHQPAFDLPQLKGQRPLDPPEGPRVYERDGVMMTAEVEEEEEGEEHVQLWRMSGETCPEGTIPIRRTTEQDLLRASSVRRFGRKPRRRVRRDSTSNGHEHAVGYVSGGEYYGAKGSINVWAPHVSNPYEFSLSQLWVISGSFAHDLNTIEAGWQVSPELYGDNYPRFFTYWTNDAYEATGCYNLMCSGFVQTNNRIAIGAAISPISSYHGGQFDITLLIWKDPKHGNWWLEFGSGILVGYWPSFLFTHLRDHATMVQFGGEIVNTRPGGSHTSTAMGSGHFAGEGFGKASYFRNLEVVDWDNNLIPLPNLRVLADHPNCYDIRGGVNGVWGHYFYYGGPGRSVRCP